MDETAQMKAALKASAHRIDACQAPYFRRLNSGKANSRIGKVDSLYDNGAVLEQNEAVEAVVAPQLTVAEKSWATIKLRNVTLRRYARAQAAEIAASLFAPKLDSCVFLHRLAQHKFSLTWAKRSAYGTVATRWLHEILVAAKPLSEGWGYIESQHLLNDRQQIGLINFLGIIS